MRPPLSSARVLVGLVALVARRGQPWGGMLAIYFLRVFIATLLPAGFQALIIAACFLGGLPQ